MIKINVNHIFLTVQEQIGIKMIEDSQKRQIELYGQI